MTIKITRPMNEWVLRAEHLKNSVSPITDSFLHRKSFQIKHPVHDFLFTYYTFSPTKLKQWVPSIHDLLEITPETLEEYPWLKTEWFEIYSNNLNSGILTTSTLPHNFCLHSHLAGGNGRSLQTKNFEQPPCQIFQTSSCLSIDQNLLKLNLNRMPKSSFKAASFVYDLSENILKQPARFNCFGLHEWAMVYKMALSDLRHEDYPLRLSEKELASFLESQVICCSHYDAYRFFTKEAKPLNVLNPTLDARTKMEQGGCLHANMDLYKWATRFWPWIGSDFIMKTFFLALDGRELDMRASPYDLEALGYPPIRIETEAGRAEYAREQKKLAKRALPLREELSAFCKSLIHLDIVV